MSYTDEIACVSSGTFPASVTCAKTAGFPNVIELRPFWNCSPSLIPDINRPRIVFLVDGNLREDLRELYQRAVAEALEQTPKQMEIAFVIFAENVWLADLSNLEGDQIPLVPICRGEVFPNRVHF